MNKSYVLVIVSILIISSIYYIERNKAGSSPAIEESGQETKTDEQIILEEVNVILDDLPGAAQESSNLDVEDVEPIMPKSDWEINRSKIGKYTMAPELMDIAGYINTEKIKLADYRGKVVLIDFWTYSCINCQRTFPYLNEWYAKYKDDGFVIIGVHTPEFNFEKIYDNVVKATENFGLEHPVVQDNNYATWRAYKNSYWPRKYLVDIDGFIRYNHIGEGAYIQTEKVIQELLKERMERLGEEADVEKEVTSIKSDVDFSKIRTRESYFGYKFTRGNFGNQDKLNPKAVTSYELPAEMEANKAYVEGDWFNARDYIELYGETGRIVLRYQAKRVNIVAGSDSEVEAEIFLDDKPVGDSGGADVNIGTNVVDVQQTKLYNIVETPEYTTHTVEIVPEKGFRIYTFTFG